MTMVGCDSFARQYPEIGEFTESTAKPEKRVTNKVFVPAFLYTFGQYKQRLYSDGIQKIGFTMSRDKVPSVITDAIDIADFTVDFYGKVPGMFMKGEELFDANKASKVLYINPGAPHAFPGNGHAILASKKPRQ